jgi:t-SNARE complex subunit (syntaxin)
LKNIDKIANVQAKVDAVTNTMQKNIESALRNTDRIEDIDEKATTLADSAKTFKNRGSQLKNTMRCRYWKMILLFSSLAIIIIIIIAVSIYYKTK